MEESIHIDTASATHIPGLLDYFSRLGAETRSRFAPHTFDEATLAHLLAPDSGHIAFIARDMEGGPVIAYAVTRSYYEPYELDRFRGYGFTPDPSIDAFYAPSVEDTHQGQGIGKMLLAEVMHRLKTIGRTRILLWGGVQATNDRALAYYRKAGFRELGAFEWNGPNLDMMIQI